MDPFNGLTVGTLRALVALAPNGLQNIDFGQIRGILSAQNALTPPIEDALDFLAAQDASFFQVALANLNQILDEYPDSTLLSDIVDLPGEGGTGGGFVPSGLLDSGLSTEIADAVSSLVQFGGGTYTWEGQTLNLAEWRAAVQSWGVDNALDIAGQTANLSGHAALFNANADTARATLGNIWFAALELIREGMAEVALSPSFAERSDQLLADARADLIEAFAGVGEDAPILVDLFSSLRISGQEISSFQFDVSEFDDNYIGNDMRDIVLDGAGNSLLIGMGGDDLLDGGYGNDTIYGVADDDLVSGGAGGDDRLFGNLGNDTVDGGDGDDTLRGQTNDDSLDGGTGTDQLFGGGNDDVVSGDAGNDIVNGNYGADTVSGGDGDDTVRGQGGADLVQGGAGDDLVIGHAGFDTLQGGAGNDTLIAGPGNDTLTGGAGADQFVFADFQASDLITDFEDGVDMLVVSAANFGALTISTQGGDAVVTWGAQGTVVTLDGIAASQLTAADFIFS